MRGIYFVLAVLLMIAFPAAAQESTDITIYRAADSLTFITAGVPLKNLALESTLANGWKVTQSPFGYPAFAGVQVAGLTCFHIVREGSDPSLPTDCQNAEHYIQVLPDSDPFWEDTGAEFSVINSLSGQIYGICTADSTSCSANITIEATPIAAIEATPSCENAAQGNEVLVVITQFEKLADSALDPSREWQTIFEDAIVELGDSVHARVLAIPQIVTNQDEATALAECYSATVIIWGQLDAERITTKYRIHKPWLPDTGVENWIFFASFDGSDDDYIFNHVRGQLLFWSENPVNALPYLRQAIKFIPKGREKEMGAAEIYYYLGHIQQIDLGDNAAAVSAYSSAIEIDPGIANIYTSRGMTYTFQAQYDLAIRDLTQAITLEPETAAFYLNRGFAYMSQGDYDLAIADFDQTIELKPDMAEAYMNRGLAHMVKDETDLAIADFDRAIEFKPDIVGVYVYRGLAYAFQKRFDIALVDLNHAIELQPDHAQAHYYRGMTYEAQGKFDLAIADYQQYVQLAGDSANPEVVAHLRELEAAAPTPTA